MPVMENIPEAASELLARRRGRRSLLHFMRYVWWMPSPFLEGVHTVSLCNRLTKAVEDFKNGISTFLLIQMPFRHGKTDVVSRALPPFFLGVCAEHQPDVIMSGYGAELVEGFSRKARSIISSERYQTLFPNVKLSPHKTAANKWAILGSAGEVTATGLGGTLTGHGGHLMVLDDYCKQREEAESEAYRSKMWDNFTNDFMTRRAPVSIVVICATPWHVDDIAGRLQKEIEENPRFPKFERMHFGARQSETLKEPYHGEYLFSERFPDEWYESQYATLGRYSSAGLLDCLPFARGGKIFNPKHVVVHNNESEFPDAQYVRAWDLASTQKEREKDDPDWTAGSKVAVTMEPGSVVPHVWVKDCRACQEEAPKRDQLIIRTVTADGSIPVLIESVAGYKDTYTNMRQTLMGIAKIHKVSVSRDKFVRFSALEPVVESGHFHVLNAPWVDDLLKEMEMIGTSNGHDDRFDSICTAYLWLRRRLRGSGKVKVHG